MTQRTYTTTYLAEVTETFTFTDDDLDLMDREVLNAWDADEDFNGGPVLTSDVMDILHHFDADHEDVSATDDPQVTIERTR